MRRIDFANNVASLVHGHAHPDIVAAVTEQLKKGSAYTLATEQEVLYAEHMCQRTQAFEKVRFVNSGTEAVMTCLKSARAYTGRSKIAKVEGAYHGIYDYAEVSQAATPDNWGALDEPARTAVVHGTPQSALDEVVVIPFNDTERARAILDRYADEIACVLVDFMPHRVGLIQASQQFAQMLSHWTRQNGALLVADEVITFRSNYGGAQQWYDIRPDLTAMGKMIGGGFPVGAIAGRDAVMEVMNPLAERVLFPHAGTFSANPVTMTAGLVSMQMFDRDKVLRLNQLADYAREQIRAAIAASGFPACVTGAGSMFRIHLRQEPPASYREGFATPEQSRLTQRLLDYLFDHGFILINTCSAVLSTVMTKTEIDLLADSVEQGLRQLRSESEADRSVA